MASKRALYSPAPVSSANKPKENQLQKKMRRPLAQGRLVTDADVPGKKSHQVLASGVEEPAANNIQSPYRSHVPTVPSYNMQRDIENMAHHRSLHRESAVNLEASRNRSGVLMDMSAISNCSQFIQKETLNSSPRRYAPKISAIHSPSRSDGANTLDLSDSERDLSYQQQSPLGSHGIVKDEVLLVDASGQNTNLNESEVNIHIGYERSPAKVICHSPRALESDFRSGAEKSAEMGLPSTCAVKLPVKAKANSAKEKKSREKPPLVVREMSRKIKSAEGGIITQMQKDSLKLDSKCPQPNFDVSAASSINTVDDTLGMDRFMSDVSDRLDTMSVASDVSDACSLYEYCSSAKKTNAKNVTKKNQPQSGKKKERIVASRYMEPSKGKAKTSLASSFNKSTKDKSIVKNSSINKNRSTSLTNIKPKKTNDTKLHVAAQSKRSENASKISRKLASKDIRRGHTEAPRTPENLHTTAKTSTPTTDGSTFPHEIDASIISADHSLMSNYDGHRQHPATGIRQAPIGGPAEAYDVSSQSMVSNKSILGDFNAKKPNPVSQKRLNLLYHRYMQWVYLASTAKKVREEQEKQAMIQMHGLHEEVEKLRKRKHEIDLELTKQTHLNSLDKHLEQQKQLLEPLSAAIPNLTTQYNQLAHALDTTRHQIPTKGIHLPEDEEQFQSKLESELLASEQLLGELSVMIRQPSVTVKSMSNALTAMEKAVDAQIHELKRCTEMLAATKSLLIQETSLKIQSMQA